MALCYMCGKAFARDTHHLIFGNGLRHLADEDGLIVPLCGDCHTSSMRVMDRIHDNVAAERLSKMLGQMQWERDYIARHTMHGESIKEHAREKFIKRYGKSYL